jgi:ribosomal protein L1
VIGGKLEYDVVLATPDVLKEIKPLGAVLRQNMPTMKKGGSEKINKETDCLIVLSDTD